MAGYRTWTPGEVITASNVQDFLMDQAVMVFASDSVRGSAIPVPTAGMTTYLEDTALVEVYNGSSWDSISGDISAITAGTAITSQETSGTVALNVDIAAIGSAIEINNNQITTSITSSTATAYEIQNSDEGKFLLLSAGSGVLTVSTATAFSQGEQVQILNDGTNWSIIPDGTAVQLYGRGSAVGTAGFLAESQYDAFSIVCVGTNAYRIIGNVTVA